MEKGNEEERLMRLPRVTWKGYAALLFAILFFAGIFASVQSAAWLRAFDFSTLIGKFGTMASDKATFVGMGGASARGGFLFALSLVPSVMLAVGCVEVLSHFGALAAAQRLMTPLLKPLMGHRRRAFQLRPCSDHSAAFDHFRFKVFRRGGMPHRA